MNSKQKKNLIRIIISAVLMIILKFMPVTGILRFALYLLPYLIIGYDILIRRLHRSHSSNALLSDRRMVPELCSRKEP